MRKAMLQFIGCIVGVAVSAYFMPGVAFEEWSAVFLTGAALGVLFLLLRPIARLLLAVFNLFTLGLLYVFVDTFLVLLASNLIDGIAIESYVWALAVSVAVNLCRHLFGAASGK